MTALRELLYKAYSPKLDRFVYGRPYEKEGYWYILGELGTKTLIDNRTLSVATDKTDKHGYRIYENDVVKIKGHVNLYKVKRFNGDNWFRFVNIENKKKTIPFWKINEKEIELEDAKERMEFKNEKQRKI